jgi:hypothetical protein
MVSIPMGFSAKKVRTKYWRGAGGDLLKGGTEEMEETGR